MVVHTVIPTLRKLRLEDLKPEASLSYTRSRPADLHSETLSHKTRVAGEMA